MGSATPNADARREREHKLSMSSSVASPPPDADAGSPRWRVAPRRIAPRMPRHDLAWTPIVVDDLHPLMRPDSLLMDQSGAIASLGASTEGVHQVSSVTASAHDRKSHRGSSSPSESLVSSSSSSSITEPAAGAAAEVVVLEAGELDPLGALAMSNTDESECNAASVADTSIYKKQTQTQQELLPHGGALSIKQRWIVHKNRVLAKFSDETFRIKASMLELSDQDADGVMAGNGVFYPHGGADDERAVSADGIRVVRQARARLEELERGLSSSSSSASSSFKASKLARKSSFSPDKTVEITQSEYIARIKQLEADLVSAWKQNMKVHALRIAIKCVKQLSDTSSAPQLYPVAFVLVTDVLDTFGQLVFGRIKTRASEDENGQPLATPLSEEFTSAQVNIHAKETCRNWFYKTACIRELLPRIYIEIALLKCYRFLCDGEYPQIVARLASMIKGVGEPMVALYTRLYLALVSSELIPPTEKGPVLSSLYDYLFTFRQYHDRGQLESYLTRQQLTQDTYLTLHSPAVEWLFECIAQNSTDSVFETVLAHYEELSGNSMVLKHVLSGFKGSYYARDPFRMLVLARTASSSLFSKCHLYSILALQLGKEPTFLRSNNGRQEADAGCSEAKLRFLNDAWSSITAQEDIAAYMECAAAYTTLIVAHYSHRETMILLKDVVRHLNSAAPGELTPVVYNQLGSLIENVVSGAQHPSRFESFFTRVIPSSEFLLLMGMFRREASVSVAKKVLRAFVISHDKNDTLASRSTNSLAANTKLLRLHVVGPEAAVAHTLFAICCRVHDALDSLSTDTERQEATRDITAFISRLGYAQSPDMTKDRVNASTFGGCAPKLSALATTTAAKCDEEQDALLMLYIDCRSAFYKLEPIKATLTKYVVALAVRVHRRQRGGGDVSGIGATSVLSPRRAFIKSCLAYAHITIPSISSLSEKLRLMVLGANAALETNCLPQMDAFLKAAIVLVTELDYGNENLMSRVGFSQRDNVSNTIDTVIADLVAVLVYAPSLHNDEPFYFVDALWKAVFERMTWMPTLNATGDSTTENVRITALAAQIRIRLRFMQLFGLWSQSGPLADRIDGVDSNDVLYGGDGAFQDRTHAMFSSLVDTTVLEIEGLSMVSLSDGDVSGSANQEIYWLRCELMLDLINQVTPLISFSTNSNEPTLHKIKEGSELGDSLRVVHARKQQGSGPILLRKCITVAFESMKAAASSSVSRRHRKSTGTSTKSLSSGATARTKALRSYWDSTMDMLTGYTTLLNDKSSLVTVFERKAIADMRQWLQDLETEL